MAVDTKCTSARKCVLGPAACVSQLWVILRQPNGHAAKLRRGYPCRGRSGRSPLCTRRLSAGPANGPATASAACWTPPHRHTLAQHDVVFLKHAANEQIMRRATPSARTGSAGWRIGRNEADEYSPRNGWTDPAPIVPPQARTNPFEPDIRTQRVVQAGQV
jgi:hypothetical protein